MPHPAAPGLERMSANLCYFIAASASVAVSLALLLRRPSSAVARRGSVACAVGGLLALLLMLGSGRDVPFSWETVVIEVTRNTAWLTVLLALLPPTLRMA